MTYEEHIIIFLMTGEVPYNNNNNNNITLVNSDR